MADSSQKFIARNRAPRVQIEYDVELYGSEKKIQLPFVMGVMSDLSGKSDNPLPVLDDRKFLEIDIDNFDDRMKAVRPRAAFTVPNTLSGEGNLAVDITFESMDDFSPAAIAAKVAPLRKLLQARTQLSHLTAYMDGKAGAEGLLGRVMQDPALLRALAGGGDALADSDAVLASIKPAMGLDEGETGGSEEALDSLRSSATAADTAEPTADTVLDGIRAGAPVEAQADASAAEALESLRGNAGDEEAADDSGEDVLASLRASAPADEIVRDADAAVLDTLGRNAADATVGDDTGDDAGDILDTLRSAAPEDTNVGDPVHAGLEALRGQAATEPEDEDGANDVLDDLRAGAPAEDDAPDAGENVFDDLKSGLADESPEEDEAAKVLTALGGSHADGVESGEADGDAKEAALADFLATGPGENPPADGGGTDDVLAALGELGDGAEAEESDAADRVLAQLGDTGTAEEAQEGGLEAAPDMPEADEAATGEADGPADADLADDLDALLSMNLDAGNEDPSPDAEEPSPAATTEPDPLDELLAMSLDDAGDEAPGGSDDAAQSGNTPDAAAPDPLDDLLADVPDDPEEPPADDAPSAELTPGAPPDDAGPEETGMLPAAAPAKPWAPREIRAGPSPGASTGGRVGLSFGMLSAPRPAPRADPGGKFRMAVLGDFSGRAAKGEVAIGDDLKNRRPVRFDIDTVEDVIEGFATTLVLPVGKDGAGIEVRLGGLDDLHPDELYENVGIFEELSGLRQRLEMASMAPAAVAELQGWGAEFDAGLLKTHRRSAANAVPPDRTLSDFQALIGDTTGRLHEPSPVSDLIARVVAPHVVSAPSAETDAMLAALDNSLSGAMRLILHHPEFQALEAQWRSLDLLARRVETDETLELVLYDVSAEEVAADLASVDDLARSGLHGLLTEAVEERGEPGYSAVFGLYAFEETPPHAEILARIARVAAHAGAPFLAAISPEFLNTAKADRHPLVAAAWDALRALPEAKYLGIATPRFLLRRPYGAKSEPIDRFAFEEFTETEGMKGMLWANPVVLAATLMAQTWTRTGKAMRLGEVMSVGDIPFHYVTDRHGDQVALPCTERNLTASKMEEVVTRGFMPVLSIRGRDEVRLGSFQALGGGEIRGPWSAADSATGPADPPPAASADPPPSPPENDVPTEPEDSPAVAADVPGDDGAGTDAEDDLDALLASFDDDGDDNDLDPDAMDPELAALLEDL